MKKFVSMLIRHWFGSPVKIILTLSAVALGTAILILSGSASQILDTQITQVLEKDGLILNMTNGIADTNGKVEPNKPPEWDASLLPILVSDIDEIQAVAPVFSPKFDQITSNGKSYNLRSGVGSSLEYFDIFSLEIIVGSPMTEEDLNMGYKKVWISREMAEIMYVSPEEALGKWIQPPGSMMRRGPTSGRKKNVVEQYTITGIYENPTEIIRRSYGIADLIIPYTSLFSSGGNSQVLKNMIAGELVFKTKSTSIEKTQSNIAQIIENNVGPDIDLVVWEGSSKGESTYMEELRKSVNIFSVAISLLGMVLLLTSSLGIFSIMVVEALNRKRDIALERALGASQIMVVKEFWTWSLFLSLIGAALGCILALIFAGPVLSTLAPLLGEVSSDFSTAAGIKIFAVIKAVLMALLFGGILGLLPSISAVKGNISDTLREV